MLFRNASGAIPATKPCPSDPFHPLAPAPPALIERELQRAERYAAGALAPSTRRAL